MKKTLLAACCVLSFSGYAAQPFTVNKLTELNKLHSVAVSPNGQFVVYGVKVAADAKAAAEAAVKETVKEVVPAAPAAPAIPTPAQ